MGLDRTRQTDTGTTTGQSLASFGTLFGVIVGCFFRPQRVMLNFLNSCARLGGSTIFEVFAKIVFGCLTAFLLLKIINKTLKKHSKIFVEQGFLYYDSDSLKASRKGMFIVDGISSKLFLIDFQEREMCNENKTLE